MANSAATNVAELESEVTILRGETDAQRIRIAVLQAENDSLKLMNARLELAIRDELRKSTEVETIINQMSIALVGAIEKMRHNREVEKQIRKMEQTDNIIAEIGGHQAPARRTPAPPVQTLGDHNQSIEEEIAEQARAIADQKGNGHHDEDERLPGVMYPRSDIDKDVADLEQIARH